MMKSLLKIATVISAIFFLVGCQPKAPQSMGALPTNYEAKIKNLFDDYLKDPESARYKFGTPVKAYSEALNDSWKGWAVPVSINAKNSYGGYGGYKTYYIPFDGNIIHRPHTATMREITRPYR